MKSIFLITFMTLQPLAFAQQPLSGGNLSSPLALSESSDEGAPRTCSDANWHWQLGEDGQQHAVCDPGHPGSCHRFGFGGASCCCED